MWNDQTRFLLEQSQALVACIHLIRPSNINILLTGVEPISRSRHHRYRKSAAQGYQEDQRAQSSVIQRPSPRTTRALVVTEETVHCHGDNVQVPAWSDRLCRV